jgi:hypothetical protein
VVPPGDKSTIQAKPFHANVLFDADWQAMERTDWLPVGCQIVIKVFGTCQSSRGKELSDAVGLSLRVRKELRYIYGRPADQLLRQPGPSEEGMRNFSARYFARSEEVEKALGTGLGNIDLGL